MKVVSLFCGIGGIDIAFRKNGCEIVWANDNDKFACDTYRYNFPETKIVETDIRTIDVESIPECDMILAGFPCQPFSVCGKQKGFEDKRGNLFFEIGKIIDSKQPSIVFLENVANLVNHDSGKTFNVIHNELAGRGYYIRYIVADACEYGNIPQHRTRTYIIAFKDELQCQDFSFPDKIKLTRRINNILDFSAKVDESFYYSPQDRRFNRLHKAIIDSEQIYRFSDYGIQASRDGISFTLKANMGTFGARIPIIKDHFGIRNITPKECLALQGFPENFLFPLTVPQHEQYKQAGNTVCIPVVQRIASALLNNKARSN